MDLMKVAADVLIPVKELPAFKAGDTVTVFYKIIEGTKEREQQFGIVRPPPFDFGGRLPGVTRVLPLAVPEGNPLRLFVPDPLTLAWSFPTIGEPAATGGDSGDPGWWVMSISPSPPGLEILPEEVHNTVAREIGRAHV